MKEIIFTIAFLFSLTNIFGQSNEPKLKISHLTGDFYIYTTYNTYEGNNVRLQSKVDFCLESVSC